MFAIIVHHYPKPEHLQDFRAFCVKVGDQLRDRTEGLLSIEGFDDPPNTRLTIVSRWASPEAAQAGVIRLRAASADVGPRNPEWSARDDDVHRLVGF